jgi:lipopolysaccharide export system permease protein
MVEVAMMLLLPLLSVALAIPPKRSSSALGVFVSIVLVVAYHKINQYGEAVASLGRIDPFLALWGPFVVFAALIVWMFYRVAYVPGGQAIGALETGFAKLAKWVTSLVKRRERKLRKQAKEEAAQAALAEGGAPHAA